MYDWQYSREFRSWAAKLCFQLRASHIVCLHLLKLDKALNYRSLAGGLQLAVASNKTRLTIECDKAFGIAIKQQS